MVNIRLFTLMDIADELHEPPRRIAYLIRKCRIKPIERVGITRLFNERQVEAIRQGISNIQVREEPARPIAAV